MSEADAIDCFVRSAMADARRKPLCEARPYLRGLLALTEGRRELECVAAIYAQLCVADDQLELIASGQMRLPLAPVTVDHPSQRRQFAPGD